jgi:hypothetical protein
LTKGVAPAARIGRSSEYAEYLQVKRPHTINTTVLTLCSDLEEFDHIQIQDKKKLST